MIEITQSGQVGKTSLLFDMHRLRTRVFRERMGWDVKIDCEGLEVDDFDLPETIYLLALNEERRVIGVWRLLPTSGPTMIRNVWPQFLDSLPMPEIDNIWEASRFAVHSPATSPAKAKEESSIAVAELFCALTELCIMAGIQEIFTLYDTRIARVIRRLNCQPYAISNNNPIDGRETYVGAFKTDQEMLNRIRLATGITKSLINHIDLPPALIQFMEKAQGHFLEKPSYASSLQR